MAPLQGVPSDAAVSIKDAASVADDSLPAAEGKRRKATWQDAAYHSVTAMVGAGVLGLPGVMASLGWGAGMVALALSLLVSWYTYKLLVDMHEAPSLDAKDGGGYRRFDRYQELTTHVMGPRAGWWALVPFQMTVLVGICITYTVVGGDDLHAAVASMSGGAAPPVWVFYVAFGGLQLVLSQLPDFSALGIVSLLGALMSFGYCLIAIVLAGMAAPPPAVQYAPLVGQGPMTGVFSVFNALSTIMFAYGGHNIALEIQATLPQPPTVGRMMRGVYIAFALTGAAYFGVAASGFRALGDAAGSNIILTLTNGPAWVRDLARLMVVVHVAAAYQVYAHPAFESIENLAHRALGHRTGVRLHYDGGSWAARFVMRAAYVVACTLIACMLPFFGYLMGLFGAIAITPTTFLLPPLLWLLYKKPPRFGLVWAANWLIVAATAVIGAMGTVGSVYLLIKHARDFKVFSA